MSSRAPVSSTWCGSSQTWCPSCWLLSSWPSTGKSHTLAKQTNRLQFVQRIMLHAKRCLLVTQVRMQISCRYCSWREQGLAMDSCSRARLEHGTYDHLRTGANRFEASRCQERSVSYRGFAFPNRENRNLVTDQRPLPGWKNLWRGSRDWTVNADPQHNNTKAGLQRTLGSSSSFTVKPPMSHTGSCVERKSLCCSAGSWREHLLSKLHTGSLCCRTSLLLCCKCISFEQGWNSIWSKQVFT